MLLSLLLLFLPAFKPSSDENVNVIKLTSDENAIKYDSTENYRLLENEKFFELKSKGYRDGIKRKRQDRDGV